MQEHFNSRVFFLIMQLLSIYVCINYIYTRLMAIFPSMFLLLGFFISLVSPHPVHARSIPGGLVHQHWRTRPEHRSGSLYPVPLGEPAGGRFGSWVRWGIGDGGSSFFQRAFGNGLYDVLLEVAAEFLAESSWSTSIMITIHIHNHSSFSLGPFSGGYWCGMGGLHTAHGLAHGHMLISVDS